VLLEGPAIEPLLAQVRDEYGSRVRIISADKVRSGGVGGFFAKQHYELSVEVPDPTEDRIDMAQRMKPAENGQPTLERLLARAESQDRSDEPVPRPPATRPIRPAPTPGFGAEESRSAAIGDTGAAFAELMAGLDVAGHQGLGLAARPSPRPKAAPDPAPAADREEPPTVRPFRPAAATSAAVNAPAPPTSPAPIHHLSPTLAERIGGLAAPTVEVEEVEAEEEISAPIAAESYGLNPLTAVALAPSSPAALVMRPSGPDPVARNLMSVGMPESMASRITGGDTYAGVLSVLAARPSAPGIPDGPGEILVLAGDVNLGVPIAKQFLDQIGASETHLLLAAATTVGTGLHSSRLISNRETAESRVDKLHNADSAWVVVLDAPVGGTDPLWVNEMCDAIGATAVWAIIDATRKTADTARHLRTLGEVEALVVHGVELTADPASILGLDLPIYSLDGKPATPHVWAAMLCARIAADVMPIAATPRRVTRTVRQ
jgi:hypothetical protein